MDIHLIYGSHAHDSGECAVQWSADPIITNGTRTGVKYIVDVRGRLHGDTQAALTTAIAALESAYDQDNKDIGLLFSDGTRTAHYLSARSCRGGTRVTRLSYPLGDGGQYSTYRDYQITVEAEVAAEDDESGILEWSETVTQIGGGRQYGFLETLNGAPQEQILKQQTVYRATQQGEAVGAKKYPPPAPPIWASRFCNDRSQVSHTSPRKVGTLKGEEYTEYRTSWSYVFESAEPLSGLPTPWPS
ncbi:MAG: hypothetical protein A2W31_06590 [Planctomycetes bacterium RBG_16_64_10]|nr:MAG: hypothetical protein A2W31_06590 [Planctomycetes bacterium RBG_16_64_10]